MNFQLMPFDSETTEEVTETKKQQRATSGSKRSFLGSKFSVTLSGFSKAGQETAKQNQKNESADAKVSVIDEYKDTLDNFVSGYKSNKTNPTFISELLNLNLIKIADIMSKYYNKDMEPIAESMNNVITLLTTKSFAISVNSYIKNNENIPDWDIVKKNIAALLSLGLETSHNKMMSETKSIYVDIISTIYDFEIKELTLKYHLTEDAALDLFVGIPHFGEKLTDAQIRGCYDTFLTMLINHGKCAIEYLNAENQKDLFYYFFRDEDRIATKAAGQCLGDERIEFEEDADQTLYEQYVKMLYEVVNEHDLDEIRMVIRYIVKSRIKMVESKSETVTVFDVNEALQYENIKTAMLDYIDHNENAKEILV